MGATERGLDRAHGLGRDGGMDTDDRTAALEERMAHLLRAVDDLSDVVARQEREIAVLTRRVRMLMEREGEREAQSLREVPIDRPPHW